MNVVKRWLEKTTGYWAYKAAYLPIGTDLRVDLERTGINLDTIFDVGANIGQTYLRFRRDFPKARIYCFEPVGQPFAELATAISGDSLTCAEQLAFGERSERKTIRIDPIIHALNSLRDDLMVGDASEVVTIDTLDSYRSRASIGRIDLLKIDTEGYEIPVILGAVQSIESGSVASVFAEVGFDRHNTRNTYFPELTELLSQKGFDFHGLYDVTHYTNRRLPSYGNALYLHRASSRS